jgi:Na+-driven multidrug efflux pump
MVAINLIIVRTPVCYALAEWTPLKERGLWLGLTVGTFAGAFLYYLYYKSGKWKNKKRILLS